MTFERLEDFMDWAATATADELARYVPPEQRIPGERYDEHGRVIH